MGWQATSDQSCRHREVSNDSAACQSMRTSSNVRLTQMVYQTQSQCASVHLSSNRRGHSCHLAAGLQWVCRLMQQYRPTQSQQRSCVDLGNIGRSWPEITPALISTCGNLQLGSRYTRSCWDHTINCRKCCMPHLLCVPQSRCFFFFFSAHLHIN